MWTLNYTKRFGISHHLALDYTSKSTHAHGHFLTIQITFLSNRLNPYNMIIDTNKLDKIIEELGNDINKYMMDNNIKGNPTLENILLIIKVRSLLLLKKENEIYNMDVILDSLTLTDEEGRSVAYDAK